MWGRVYVAMVCDEGMVGIGFVVSASPHTVLFIVRVWKFERPGPRWGPLLAFLSIKKCVYNHERASISSATPDVKCLVF